MSALLVPLMLAAAGIFALSRRVDAFSAMLTGAREGLNILSGILPSLVVLNTASVQLLPATVASVRAACGAADAFDILPCVWVSSLASVTVGLFTARLLERFSKNV